MGAGVCHGFVLMCCAVLCAGGLMLVVQLAIGVLKGTSRGRFRGWGRGVKPGR